MFETTLAGSLPKPSWLATPNVLWAPWTLTGAPLQEAKEDATALSIKRQEDAGIDIVSDGEQARQHFVHGFLAEVDGVDFGQEAVDEMLPRLLAVAHDVDTRLFLAADRKRGGVFLGLLQWRPGERPRRPQDVGRGQP